MKRPSLSDTIFEDLKKRIIAGEFPLRSKIPTERALAAHYQVSRIPVRDALKKLEEIGAIEKLSGSGSTVISIPVISLKDKSNTPIIDETTAFLETVRLRRLIECEAARTAALHATPEGVERIQQALFNSISEIRKFKSNEKNCFFEADLNFHRTIAAESGNKLLADCLDAIPTVLNWQQYWSLSITNPKDEVIAYHTLIFENILDKNGAKAYESMSAHLSRVEELIQTKSFLSEVPSIFQKI